MAAGTFRSIRFTHVRINTSSFKNSSRLIPYHRTNMEERSLNTDTNSVCDPVRDTQSQSVLQILYIVAGMAQNYSSWYTKSRSKEVFSLISDARVIYALNLALKCPVLDIPLLACQVIRGLFGGKNRDQFEPPPLAYRVLSFEIQDSECMVTLSELLRCDFYCILNFHSYQTALTMHLGRSRRPFHRQLEPYSICHRILLRDEPPGPISTPLAVRFS